MAQEFGGRVRFAVENYGDSALARRFGVKLYPAIFVDDVLVATPHDFFRGPGDSTDGRYVPFKTAESHERFRQDLSRIIGLILGGREKEAAAQAKKQEKLVMVLHVSGHFEDPGLT